MKASWTALTAVLALLYTVQGDSVLRFQPQAPEKVWLFAVDGLKRPYSFVDPTGQLVGFDVDVISAVCEIAKQKCEMVLADFKECSYSYRNMNFPGRGLMAGWFDACPGYAITLDRLSTFAFTDPYLRTVATFTVAPNNPYNFNPEKEDYTNFTLSHLTGAPTNEACLNRLHKKFGKIIIANDLPEAKDLLLKGTTQALFSPRTRIEGLEVLTQYKFRCDIGGAGVMVKKGSALPTWWNPAFKTFVTSGAYQTLCAADSKKFNYDIKCLPQPPVSTDTTDN